MSGFLTRQPEPPFALSEQDKRNPFWLQLKAYLEDELDMLRNRNDAPRPKADTAMLRGEIRALKRVISLGDDRPVTGDMPYGDARQMIRGDSYD